MKGRMYNLKIQKKSFKLFISTTICFVVLNVNPVFAYESPSTTSMYFDKIKYDGWVYGPWRTKNIWCTQAYENLSTWTALTNPCPKCQIMTKLTGNGNLSEGIITVTGQKKDFSNTDFTGAPDDYQMMIKRADFTLLETVHSSIWYINKNN